MKKKYELTKEIIKVNNHTLHRIKSLKDFSDVKKGELGGFIESEKNLSQDGDCWIHDEARVYENAKVYGNARLYENARVFSNAEVYGEVKIFDNAKVFGSAKVYGNAEVFDYAQIYGNAQVYDHSQIYDNVWIKDNSKIHGNSIICNDVQMYNNAEIDGFAKLYGLVWVGGDVKISNVKLGENIILKGDAIINSNSDFIIFRKFWDVTSNKYIIYTRSNNMFSCNDFYGSEEEFIKYELEKSKENGVNVSLFIEFIKMIKYGKEV